MHCFGSEGTMRRSRPMRQPGNLDPTSKLFLAEAAWLTILDGEPDKGIAFLDQARAIDPNVDGATSRVALRRRSLSCQLHDCGAILRESRSGVRGWWVEYVYLTAATRSQASCRKLRVSKAELLRLRPDFSIGRYQAMVARFSHNPAYERLVQERLLAGLRKAGALNDVNSKTKLKSGRYRDRAGSFSGSTSAAHSLFFQPGTGVSHPAWGTKGERSTR